jgi:hypothetical protein
VQRTGPNRHYQPFFPCAYDAIGEIVARYRTLDNNSFTVNGLQSEIWHLISDVFLIVFTHALNASP